MFDVGAALCGADPKTVFRYVALRGVGAERWLREACAVGSQRIPTKMVAAVDLACLVGRFAEHDLARIVDLLHRADHVEDLVIADEADEAEPGTIAWVDYGATS